MWSDTSWTPPEKFGCVERGLYRSAFPTTASHEYLKLLGLRTVVNLSQELPMRAVISGFEDLGAELINLGLAVWTRPGQPSISHELIKEALQLVLDVQRQPVLLISASGTHEVGTLVGCLRRLQVCVCVCVCALSGLIEDSMGSIFSCFWAALPSELHDSIAHPIAHPTPITSPISLPKSHPPTAPPITLCQHWNLASIFDEYRSYAAPSPRMSCEQFIELWDMDLIDLPQANLTHKSHTQVSHKSHTALIFSHNMCPIFPTCIYHRHIV